MQNRRLLVVSLLGVAVIAAGAAGWRALQRETGTELAAEQTLLDRYCVDCHNPIDLAGSLNLEDRPLASVGDDAEIWERVVRKLNTGMMPPADAPRPERATLDALAAALETHLDQAAAERPIDWPAPLRRLNRSEYANAIRDLLDLDIDAATLLPLDNSSEGFDNIAASLNVSPSLVEAYVSSAMKISRQALGDRSAPRTQVVYSTPPDLDQSRHLEGMPPGTRGGLRIEHLFPLDAEYELRIRNDLDRTARFDVVLNGSRLDTQNNGTFRMPFSAGPHTLTLALLETRRSVGVDDIYSAPPPTSGISSVEIDGPLEPGGVGDTPSRRRILLCEPASSADENACARRIIADIAGRAFRRPLAEADLAPIMAEFESGRAAGDFETGIQHALARILVDPRFLYRIERDPSSIDDYELATRLSFFLWSSIPDDELLAVAASGRLHEAEVLAAETRRMLADPKANALVENFAAQWLFLRELESITPDAESFDANLRQAMARESKLLFETIMREDLSILRLLDADFTFVDERLARHYGYPGIRGSHFRRIGIPADSPRRGLLGHGSILTLTSVTNRTSPVIRGSWILETLLGTPAPVPPPDVETTLEGDAGDTIARSVRDRLEAHRANPVCASCHAIMDPLGFTLENFDLTGAWRDTDGGYPIDASGTLTDGTVVDGPAALREALLGRSDAFVTTAAERLLTYALGRRLEYYDMPAIRAIVAHAAAEDYRFSALVLAVVASEQFRTTAGGESR